LIEVAADPYLYEYEIWWRYLKGLPSCGDLLYFQTDGRCHSHSTESPPCRYLRGETCYCYYQVSPAMQMSPTPSFVRFIQRYNQQRSLFFLNFTYSLDYYYF